MNEPSRREIKMTIWKIRGRCEKCLTVDNIIHVAAGFERQTGHKALSIRMNQRTVKDLLEQTPLLRETDPSKPTTPASIYGIPLVLDDSVPLGRFRIVLPKT